MKIGSAPSKIPRESYAKLQYYADSPTKEMYVENDQLVARSAFIWLRR